MRIALGQIDMGFEEKEKTMTLCSRLLAEAKEKQVDFVIFPEMTLTGFTLNPETYGEDRKNSPSMAFSAKKQRKTMLPSAMACPYMKTELPQITASFWTRTGISLQIMQKFIPSPSAQRQSIIPAVMRCSFAR